MLHDFDILIIGGGIVGGTLSLALANQPLKIGIIEMSAEHSQNLKDNAPRDERAIALTPASTHILESLGVWDILNSKATPIHQVHVSEAGHFGSVKFSAKELGVPALGQVASAHDIVYAVQEKVEEFANIVTLYGATLEKLERDDSGYKIHVNISDKVQTFTARLLIAADGENSLTRKLLNIPVRIKDYGQNAVVSILQLSKPHQGVAYEKFMSSGPIAALPFSDNRYVVIWTLNSSDTKQIMSLSEAEFIEQLQVLWGYRLGRIISLKKRVTFPLRGVFAENQVLPHAMLIGNAAHALHPVAAQGLNLSLKDISLFAEMVKEAVLKGQDPTRFALLESYAEKRQKEQHMISNFTNGLLTLFSNDWLPLALARNSGMLAMSFLPSAKRMFAKRAMGMAGYLPELVRG